MLIKELVDYLESIAPLEYQESYDNSGLIVGDKNDKITNVLVSLDSTESVIDEAIEKGCNIVIAHHPIIFKGLKKLTGKNYIERTIIKAIKNDIAIYACHTNLDNITGGVSFKMELVNDLQIVGSGAIGILEKPLAAKEFLSFLKTNMAVSVIKHTNILSETIQRVALCGGSGGFLLNNAIAAKADIFITSDYKYHEYFDADKKIVIADIGHYESEQFTKELIRDEI
ncbi:UNVERIFIED_CONTAM: hypothetical protein GTU68_020608, partial [Idotea baltica]|nr:hypothetical protein [Idotea baltica]